MHQPKKSVKAFKVIFWDFDGVIKDSVEVKTTGYEQLFLPYGQDIARRVRQHHEVHGGVSRYEKIPLYLGWAGEPVSEANAQDFCQRFSSLVQRAVIDSAWVPGVREYLLAHHLQQHFVLVTATPQQEIEDILDTLGIADYFRGVHGAPTSKTHAIKAVLGQLKCLPGDALMVGDSETDLQAALANDVPFLLRCTPHNQALRQHYAGPMFDRLNDE